MAIIESIRDEKLMERLHNLGEIIRGIAKGELIKRRTLEDFLKEETVNYRQRLANEIKEGNENLRTIERLFLEIMGEKESSFAVIGDVTSKRQLQSMHRRNYVIEFVDSRIKETLSLEKKMLFSALVGKTVRDLYAGRAGIKDKNTPRIDFIGFKKALESKAKIAGKSKNEFKKRITREELEEFIDINHESWGTDAKLFRQKLFGLADFDKIMRIYMRRFNDKDIQACYDFARKFQAGCEDIGCGIIDLSPVPLKYHGQNVTSASQTFFNFRDKERRIDTLIIKFQDSDYKIRKKTAKELFEEIKNDPNILINEGDVDTVTKLIKKNKKEKHFEDHICYFDFHGKKRFIVLKNDLLIDMSGDNRYRYFLKDSFDIMSIMLSIEINTEELKEAQKEILRTTNIPPGQNLSALNYRLGFLELGAEWFPEDDYFEETLSLIERDYSALTFDQTRTSEFKCYDYIKYMKENGYQSLHYLVVINNILHEVQIRTPRMHYTAAMGTAKHKKFKDKVDKRLDKGIDNLIGAIFSGNPKSEEFLYNHLRQTIIKEYLEDILEVQKWVLKEGTKGDVETMFTEMGYMLDIYNEMLEEIGKDADTASIDSVIMETPLKLIQRKGYKNILGMSDILEQVKEVYNEKKVKFPEDRLEEFINDKRTEHYLNQLEKLSKGDRKIHIIISIGLIRALENYSEIYGVEIKEEHLKKLADIKQAHFRKTGNKIVHKNIIQKNLQAYKNQYTKKKKTCISYMERYFDKEIQDYIVQEIKDCTNIL